MLLSQGAINLLLSSEHTKCTVWVIHDFEKGIFPCVGYMSRFDHNFFIVSDILCSIVCVKDQPSLFDWRTMVWKLYMEIKFIFTTLCKNLKSMINIYQNFVLNDILFFYFREIAELSNKKLSVSYNANRISMFSINFQSSKRLILIYEKTEA